MVESKLKRVIMDIEDCITQLEEVFVGQPWFGPSFLKSLENTSFELWDYKSEGISHTIAELIQHIIDWRIFVIEKLKGNEKYSIEMNSEKDWKPYVSVDTHGNKEAMILELKTTQDTLCQLLETKPDSWLYEFVFGKEYTNEYMIRGLLQHDIYHLGQVNMIANMIKNK